MTIAILAFFIGILSGIFSSFIGGGAGTIGVPLFMLIGLPPYAAVSTTKTGALGIAIGSLTKFWGTKYIRWQYIPMLLFIAVASGIAGALLLLETPEYILSKIVAILLIVSVIGLYSRKGSGVVEVATSRVKRGVGYIAYFFTEGLRAAFGSGFGMLTGAVMVYFFGMTMLESNATKRLSGVVVSLIALVVFLFKGIISIPAGIGMFLGSIIGSYIGTHYTILIGDAWVKTVYTIFAVIMATVLLVTNNVTLF